MLGYIGDVYSSTLATVLTVGTWFVGYAVVNILVEPDGEGGRLPTG